VIGINTLKRIDVERWWADGRSYGREPGQEISWGEMFVGERSVFAAAGFREVSRPTKRRVVMRIDFEG